MFDMDQLAKELCRDEAIRLKPYRDSVGKLTIGIGRNLDDVGITVGEAMLMLHNDITRTVDDLNAWLPWWNTLDDVRQRVLMNMAFNMGIGGLLTFTNTLDLIRTNRFLDAAQHMLDSKWAKQVGPRAERLALMMRDGSMPGGNAP